MIERITSAEVAEETTPQEAQFEETLRPKSFDSYVGQVS